MTTKRLGRVSLVALALGSLPLTAFADEIVHFTNGAEMTVRSHTVEKTKEMVKLDLGGNSFISFPMSMVDKIVSAGQDVFLNPVFHPSNQAIAGVPGTAVASSSTHGSGEPVPYTRKPGAKLGEGTETQPIPAGFGAIDQKTVANTRKAFNPAVPQSPGAPPQVIMPPGFRPPVQMTAVPSRPAPPATPPVTPPAPANNEPPDSTPPTDPPEDPPDAP